MDTLFGGNQHRKVKRALRNSGRPLDQEEIAEKAGLSVDETREIVGSLVDRGEATTTLGWKYTLTE